jgi:hypothetical protein
MRMKMKSQIQMENQIESQMERKIQRKMKKQTQRVTKKKMKLGVTVMVVVRVMLGTLVGLRDLLVAATFGAEPPDGTETGMVGVTVAAGTMLAVAVGLLRRRYPCMYCSST